MICTAIFFWNLFLQLILFPWDKQFEMRKGIPCENWSTTPTTPDAVSLHIVGKFLI